MSWNLFIVIWCHNWGPGDLEKRGQGDYGRILFSSNITLLTNPVKEKLINQLTNHQLTGSRFPN